jgi:histidyl-tRNA synthetase
MPERFRAPRGAADILPADQPYWQFVRRTAARVARSYGYGQIDTPVFEDARVYLRRAAAGTDVADKEIYLFEDRGGDKLALRPEGTAGVCRAYLEHGMGSLPQPIRLFYIAPNFRYDRPQAGRYRVHHQFGVEAIGDGDASIDAEVIDLLASFYMALGLTDWRLALNSIGDGVCRPGYIAKLRAYYAGKLDRLCADCRRRYDENPLRLLDCKQEQCQPFKAGAPKFADNLCEPCAAHFAALKGYLDALALPYAIDHTLVRGLDYYTRTVFEVQPPEEGAQSSLGGGGRYDGLMEQLGGPPTPAAGFGTGVERVILNLKRLGIEPGVDATTTAFVAVADEAAAGAAMRLARDLRVAGLTVVTGAASRSLRSQLRQANAAGASVALIIGKEELAANEVTLRDLTAATQERLPIDTAVARLRGAKI